MPTWTGAVSTDWNTAGNWVTPSAVPTSTTDAIFIGTPVRNCTTGTAARLCLNLVTTGYLGTLEVGSSTAGYLRVLGNITLGSTAGHITATGLAYIGIEGTTCALDVASGFTVPYLAFGAGGLGGTCTVTLTRSFAVTKILKAGVGGSVTTVTAGSAMTMDLTSGSISGLSLTMAANVTLTINGSCNVAVGGFSYSGNMTLASGSTLTLLAGLSFSSTATFDCSAGTFTPGVQSATLPNAFVTLNMGPTNSFYNLGGGGGIASLITMLSTIRITNNYTPSGIAQMNGAFDVIVGGNISLGSGTIGNSTPGRKLTLKGTSTGVSSITSWSSSNIQLEIDCGSNGFALTGSLAVVSINYLATNTGSFTTTGSTLVYNNNLSINMNGSTNSWNILNGTTGTPTLTLLSDVYCNTLGVANGDKINGPGFYVITTGSTNSMSNVSGTGSIKFVGSSNATWNQTAATTNALASIVFAKTAPAAVIISNSFNYTGTLLKWDSGTVTHSGTLTLGSATTVNTTSAVSWNNITIPASATITISSLFYIVGTLAITSGTTTFTGTAGWTCGTLTCSTASTIIVLQSGVTYTTTTSVTMLGTNAGKITMRSNAPTVSYAIWTLQNPASQSMVYVSATAIDSSLGMTIYSFGGIIGTTAPVPTLNWYNGASQGTKAFTFVS